MILRIRNLAILLFFGFVCVAPAAVKPGEFYASGSAASTKIALTFDDGPGPHTPEFLDLLQKHQIKATFFVLGDQVKLRPDMARAIRDMGHEIGSHTMQHMNYKARLKKIKASGAPNAEAKAQAELVADMKRSREVIEKATGQKLTLLRMPHGIDGPWIHSAAKQAGFTLINWTYGTDWDGAPGAKQIPGYVKALKPGAIILLHDGWPKTQKSLEITEAVIKAAKEKGLEIVTVGELLR